MMADGFLKDYQPVEDRLRQFWEEHPYGRVLTELLHHEDGDYIVLASVYFGDETKTSPATATGLAHDSVSTLPNQMKTSALEVCETSAIGRALANAGYAPKGKRPSREEMLKASRDVGDGEAASGGVTPAASSTQPPTSPWGSDEQPTEAPSQPEEAGEASSSSGGDIDAEPATPDIDNTFATPDQWDELLKRVGGSQTKARNLINGTNKTAYTQKTVYQATVAEVAKALAT